MLIQMLQVLKQAKIHARDNVLLGIDLTNCVTLKANNILPFFEPATDRAN
jgi:hypothetical protein